MSFTLPNPTSPNANDPLTSLPIRQNFQAIATGLNAIDGTSLNAKSVQEGALADSINPRLSRTNAGASYVVSGFIIANSASTSIIIPSGIAYVSGYYVNSVGGSVTIPTNQDSYIDVTTTGQFTVSSVASNAASPTLQPATLRLAKVIGGPSGSVQVLQSAFNISPVAPNISSWFGFDSLGNHVYNTSPTAPLIGYTELAPFSTSSTTPVLVTGGTITVQVPANRNIKLSMSAVDLNSTTNAFLSAVLYDGPIASNVVALNSASYSVGGNNDRRSITNFRVFNYGNGAPLVKTFNLGVFTSAGTLNLESPAVIAAELD